MKKLNEITGSFAVNLAIIRQNKEYFGKKIYGIDFDGTCVTHNFPYVGDDVPGAVAVLRALSDSGARLILNTIRCNEAKLQHDENITLERFLQSAVEWFERNDIPLFGANCNPEQSGWSKSPKIYCNHYIDDAAIGCPLIYGVHSRPFVDWERVAQLLIADLLRF